MENRILSVDEFIAKLWEVHLKVKEEGYVQVRYCCKTIFNHSHILVLIAGPLQIRLHGTSR